MNHHHRDLRRMARSAECRTGITPTDPEVLEALVRKAREAGVVVFLKAELERMPWPSREIIEAEARRLYGNRERGR